MSDIEWTDATWNPFVGCSRVSPGCEHCYAERFVHRGLTEQHRGLTVLGKGEKGPRWTGEVRLVHDRLSVPVRWRKPRRIFVNSLSDLFHDALDDGAIDAVMGAMWACLYATDTGQEGHVFQVLTKRPARMRAYFAGAHLHERWARAAVNAGGGSDPDGIFDQTWMEAKKGPHPRLWLGVTAEDQQRADERIPVLLDTPAARRFVSYEPALGPIDFTGLGRAARGRDVDALRGVVTTYGYKPRNGSECGTGVTAAKLLPALSWLIVGGESGPGARAFDLAWARSAVAQCKAAGTPVFYKQGGASNRCEHSSKGACLDCAPPELRVREFPR